MDIKKDIKNSVRLATDAATDVAQALVEKSRLRANANRIKQVIKGDTQMMNQAYIELGKYFYENLRYSAEDEQEALCVVVDKTTARINKASKKYVEILSKSDNIKFSGENADKLKTAMSEKAVKIKESTKDKVEDIKAKTKDKATDLSQKAKAAAQDISIKAKATAQDISEKAKDKVDDFKVFIAPDENIDEIIEGEDELQEIIAQQEEIIAQAQKAEKEDACVDEESPDEFTF